MFKCKECDYETDKFQVFFRHLNNKHLFDREKIYLRYFFNGTGPLCKCGCKERTRFISCTQGYKPFKNGHRSIYNKKMDFFENKYEFVCKVKDCQTGFDNYTSLMKHINKTHKIKSDEYYVEYYLDGIWPKCKCGCGENVLFGRFRIESMNRFRNYRPGHKARVENFGNDRGYKKSAETRRKMLKTGEIVVWNKDKDLKEYWGDNFEKNFKLNTKESIRKRSKSLKGLKKSESHKAKMLEQLKINRHNRLKTKKPSYPEKLMSKYLNNLEVNYEPQYEIDGFHYDFYLTDYNILIEVDGDYYHAHPDIYTELDAIQRKNRGLDIVKNSVAKQNNKKLLRFWECDIKNNERKIINEIKEYIK